MSHPDPSKDSYDEDDELEQEESIDGVRCPMCYPRQGALRKLEGSTMQTWMFCDGCGGTWSLAECLMWTLRPRTESASE